MTESTGRRNRTARYVAALTLAAVAAVPVAAQPAHAQVIDGSGTQGWMFDTSQTLMRGAAYAVLADSVWPYLMTGKGVGVALIDTGVTPVAGLKSGNVVNGPDLSLESQDPTKRYLDGFGHGTHLAGIIAGRESAPTVDNFTGIAPDVKLTSVKVGASNGAVDVTQTIAAIDWVIQHKNDDPKNPIRIINLAYGTDGVQDYKLDPLTHAVENAWRAGIVVVVAGGNDGVTAKLANPAQDPYVIAVGASDTKNSPDRTDDSVAGFTSRGTSTRRVDMVAPGRSIVSLRVPGSHIDTNYAAARVGTRFFRGSGSSQAAAIASGSIALLLQSRPSLTPDQVKTMLKTTTRPLINPATVDQGVGMLNIYQAYQSLTPPTITQTWAKSTGKGTFEKARGTFHISDNGVQLTGENDVFGPISAATWATQSSAKTAWKADGTWQGHGYTGTAWGVSAAGLPSWLGRAWSGRAWSGRAWSTGSWSGVAWLGDAWS
jgi:serine protease AprX